MYVLLHEHYFYVISVTIWHFALGKNLCISKAHKKLLVLVLKARWSNDVCFGPNNTCFSDPYKMLQPHQYTSNFFIVFTHVSARVQIMEKTFIPIYRKFIFLPIYFGQQYSVHNILLQPSSPTPDWQLYNCPFMFAQILFQHV
jgi:hypothetical protein